VSSTAALEALLAVERARTAARAGDLAAALTLLEGLESADALDLRARVHAQRGEVAAADACWARVQELRPGDRGAAAGRRALVRTRRVRPVWVATAALTLAIAGAAYVVTRDTPPVVTAGPAPRPTDAREAAPQPSAPDPLDRLTAALSDLPGIRVEQRAGDVRLLFTEGLFPSGTRLSPQGADRLAAVGRALAELDADITVVGHSVVVPGGRPSGGSPMALARAQVAAQHLAEAGGRPLTAFALRTGDQREAPLPDPADNRTVSLLLTPR
jgi:flagellar motor protein MotB